VRITLSNFPRPRGILYPMRMRRTKTETEADLMLRAAQRASARPQFMAWLLARADTKKPKRSAACCSNPRQVAASR
jgi:hypothetical protein